MKRILALFLILTPFDAAAQSSVATGDTRVIAQPTFPATSSCTVIHPTKFMALTNKRNIDPWNSTCGSTGGTYGVLGCTGGTDWEPSLTQGSYTQAESLDNTLVSNALSAAGSCVELAIDGAGHNGIVMKPFSIPSGKKLIVDAGVWINGSSSPSDYGGSTCGTMSTSGTSCNKWITTSGTSGSGIYGYGILNGRGWDTFITGATTQSFYYQRLITYCAVHGGTIPGSPTCPSGLPAYQKAYGPNGFNLVGDTNFTLYKITMRDAGNFLLNWENGNGLTAWGVKLIAPFEMSNTDGFDPLNSTNGTFTYGDISNGDNLTALKATSAPVTNISVVNSQFGAGVGLALGTDLRKGVSNVLFNADVINGNLYDGRQKGIDIGTQSTYGGPVSRVTYQNLCIRNEPNTLNLISLNTSPAPTFANMLFRNITVLPSTTPYTTGNSGTFNFQGYSGNQLSIQLDNFQVLGTNQGGTDKYTNLYKGPGTVSASILSQFTGGTGNVITGSTSATTPYACTNSSWSPLIGELNIATSTNYNNQSLTLGSSAPFTLQAVLQPSTEINTKEQPAISGSINFYDNCTTTPTSCTPLNPTPIALSSTDGFYASYAVASVSSGTHNYFAYLTGDSYYAPFIFGNVTVVNGTPTAPVPVTTSGTLKIINGKIQ